MRQIKEEFATVGVNDVLLIAGFITLALVPFVLLANKTTSSARGGY